MLERFQQDQKRNQKMINIDVKFMRATRKRSMELDNAARNQKKGDQNSENCNWDAENGVQEQENCARVALSGGGVPVSGPGGVPGNLRAESIYKYSRTGNLSSESTFA